jgi:hypothetical protein
VSTFAEECRREWKRLGVPDAVANEMAADLEADLAEAEAEGASAEDVLGSAVFDARSFAASWAAERGVIGPVTATQRFPRRSRMFIAFAAPALLVAVGAAVVIVAAPSAISRQALARPAPFRLVRPPLGGRALPRLRLLAPRFPAGQAVSVQIQAGIPTAGVVLLLVGFAGLVCAVVYWLRRPRRFVRY